MKIPPQFRRSMLYAFGLTFAFFLTWEFYWRSQGYPFSYNEDNAAWANVRARVVQGDDPKVVLIGSSRVKFDIDLQAFEQATGTVPFQLALHGSSPIPALHDLANDTLFNGTLLVGVVEGLFFAPPNVRPVTEMANRVKYYHQWSPAQKGSFYVSRTLESNLVFLDQEYLSLNSFYNRISLPERPGVWVFPSFPLDWQEVDEYRQSRLTPRLLTDTALQAGVRSTWNKLGMLNRQRMPAGDTLLPFLNAVKASVEKLRQRGVQVYFLKLPVDSPYWETEQSAFPRPLFWDRLLSFTGTPGIHFQDYPALKKYKCPEGSHLAPADAITFTKELVDILKSEKGWNPPAPSANWKSSNQ